MNWQESRSLQVDMFAARMLGPVKQLAGPSGGRAAGRPGGLDEHLGSRAVGHTDDLIGQAGNLAARSSGPAVPTGDLDSRVGRIGPRRQHVGRAVLIT